MFKKILATIKEGDVLVITHRDPEGTKIFHAEIHGKEDPLLLIVQEPSKP